ncbi:MAG: glutamine-hydrolyzing carbamoyl-phosphate synthase small subunit [Patescibacteria group bacterium]
MQKILTLADGTTAAGESFGHNSAAEGEVVFATGMVGYPESFTDPSYTGQILIMTYPLIGNYGVPKHGIRRGGEHGAKVLENFESEKMHIAGLVVSEYSEKYSHHAAKESLAAWLKREKIPAITGVDTRALTQNLREHGTILGSLTDKKKVGKKFYDPAKDHLVAKVSPKKSEFFKGGKKTVAILDCGMKLNILRNFLKRGVSVWHLPHDTNLADYEFDGLFISNGPGDPENAMEAVASIRKQLKGNKPIFGICLGNQLLALAAGMRTYKLPYGHRSQNQPVREIATSKCFITSQNHGYAVEKKVKPGWEVAYENLNDQSVEGLCHKTKPFFSVQFHPEANPGPTDTEFLFDEFIAKL